MLVVLALILAIQTDSFADQSQYDSAEFTSTVPSAGLVIAIDPDRLFAHALLRSWNCIDERCGKRVIQSKPLAKVNFQLKPQHSFGSAAVCLQASGTTAGETITKTSQAKIFTDSLTKFKIQQNLQVQLDGIFGDAPAIQADTNQTFNRAESTAPFGSMLAAFPYRHLPNDVKIRSDEFAHQLVRRRYNHAIAAANQAIAARQFQFQRNYPALACLDWQISSDSQHVFLAAGFGDYTLPTPYMPSKHAVKMMLHDSQATHWLAQQFAAQTFTNDHINACLQKTTDRDDTGQKPWSITFLDRAADIRFHDGKIDVRLGFENFTADQRVFPAVAIRVVYRIHSQNGKWTLVRDGDMEIRGTSNGARQKVLRSVMRQRISPMIPESIPLKLPPTNQRFVTDLDLRIDHVSAHDSILCVAFKAN